jgi:hypothetical protein
VSGCDGIVDEAAAVSNPSNPAAYQPAFDSGDHLHPNVAGLQAIASAVDLSLFNTAAAQPTSLEASFNNVGVTQDTNTAPGNIDGGHASLSAGALAAAGLVADQPVNHGGISLTWPSEAGTGNPDNTVADGQLISLPGSGNALDMLVTSTYGPASGSGTITYTDGSTQTFTLGTPDWFGGSGADVVAQAAYQNRQGNVQLQIPADVYFVDVPINSSKTVATVQLPKVSSPAVAGVAALHIFAMGIAATPGSVVGLNASNGLWVSSNNGSTTGLTANQPARNGWENFVVTDAGNGDLALRANNNRYVSVSNTGVLVANGTAIDPTTSIQVTHNPDGSVSLISVANKKVVTSNNGASPLAANQAAIAGWEKFKLAN